MTLAIPNTPLDIKASDWNDLMRMLRVFKMGGFQPRTTGLNLRSGGNGGSRMSRILVRNDSGNTVPLFGCLALQAPLSVTASVFVETKFETPTFKGITPTSSYWGKWAVLQEPAPYDSNEPQPVYWAIADGLTWCNVNIQDTQDVAVEHNNSTQELVTQMHGSARIIWKEDGTGTGKIALIQMGDWVTEMVGKTDAAISQGASGTVSVYTGFNGTDTGVNVTAYNSFGNIAITKWVKVTSVLGSLGIVAAQCP